MKKEDFESFKRGIAEAGAYLDGKRAGYVVHIPLDRAKLLSR